MCKRNGQSEITKASVRHKNPIKDTAGKYYIKSVKRPMVSLAQFERVGISPDMRAQDLTPQDYITLSRSIS